MRLARAPIQIENEAYHFKSLPSKGNKKKKKCIYFAPSNYGINITLDIRIIKFVTLSLTIIKIHQYTLKLDSMPSNYQNSSMHRSEPKIRSNHYKLGSSDSQIDIDSIVWGCKIIFPKKKFLLKLQWNHNPLPKKKKKKTLGDKFLGVKLNFVT